MTTDDKVSSLARRVAWLVLLIIAVGLLALIAAPVWIIQPFKAQSARGLAASYAMRSWAPLVTVAGLVVSFLLVGWLWPGTHRWIAKIALVILLVPVIAAAWFARQNHFEWMFKSVEAQRLCAGGGCGFRW